MTPLAVPVNLIAGSSHYSYWRFLAFDVTGELIWVLLYGSLGDLFADSWDVLNDLVGDLRVALGGLVALGVGGYLAHRHWWTAKVQAVT